MGSVASSTAFFTTTNGGAKMTPEEAIIQLQQQKRENAGVDDAAETEQKQQQQQKSASTSKGAVAAAASNVLPLLANGRFEVGCADIMLAEVTGREPEEGVGILARIFYPSAEADGSSIHDDPEKASTTALKDPPTQMEYMRWKLEQEYVDGLAKYREMSVVKMNFFLDWIVGDKRIPVRWHEPVVRGGDDDDGDGDQDQLRFPVLLFSHGISGNRFVYTTLCASLASHGFVVAALEHRDGSSCYTFSLEREEASAAMSTDLETDRGKLIKKPIEMIKLPYGEEEYGSRVNQVRKRVAELRRMRTIFAKLNAGTLTTATQGGEGDDEHILLGEDFDWSQFKGRLDVAAAVSMGHSFGGASALAACASTTTEIRDDPSSSSPPADHPSADQNRPFAACIILDGWLYPLERHLYAAVNRQPVLMLSASKWQWPSNVKRMQRLLLQPAAGAGEHADCSTKMMFTFKDIVHQSFSDFGFLAPGRVGRYFRLQGELDPLVTGTALLELCIAFLQQHAALLPASPPPAGGGAEAAGAGGCCDALRAIVAAKYAHFVQEGTDIAQEKLDEIGEEAATEGSAAVAEEEERLANDDGEAEEGKENDRPKEEGMEAAEEGKQYSQENNSIVMLSDEDKEEDSAVPQTN